MEALTQRAARRVLLLLALTLVPAVFHVPSSAALSFGTVTEWSTPSYGPEQIVPGPDGNLWFPEWAGKIAMVSLQGHITEIPNPESNDHERVNGANPVGITTAPDRALWFTEINGDEDNNPGEDVIGRMTLARSFGYYSVPGMVVAGPNRITTGPDGNLWFTEPYRNVIARITPLGSTTEFPVPTASAYPAGIAVGPDGNLWFTEYLQAKVGRITSEGHFTEFNVPAGASYPPYVYGITAGPDGNLWFTEQTGNQVGRISVTGASKAWIMPDNYDFPTEITAGPDGTLWFTASGFIGRITTNGQVTKFPVTANGTNLLSVTTGPDGNIWFTDHQGSRVGRVWTASAGTVYVFLLAPGFVPAGRGVRLGSAVEWLFRGPTGAAIADASGLGLFGSAAKATGTSYSHTFTAAATYLYEVAGKPSMAGQIQVPVRVQPASGTRATSFTVTWATAAPPAGDEFDVQLKPPGATAFVPWHDGVATTSASFKAATAGTYAFRARVRSVSGTTATAWSPATIVSVM